MAFKVTPVTPAHLLSITRSSGTADFMEHGELLLISQEPATCPYPVPVEYNPLPRRLQFIENFIIIFHPRAAVLNELFPSGFATKISSPS